MKLKINSHVEGNFVFFTNEYYKDIMRTLMAIWIRNHPSEIKPIEIAMSNPDIFEVQL